MGVFDALTSGYPLNYGLHRIARGAHTAELTTGSCFSTILRSNTEGDVRPKQGDDKDVNVINLSEDCYFLYSYTY